MCGGPIVWFAQKQKVTAISSAEAEYRAAVLGIQEVSWIRRVVKELKMQDLSNPTDFFIDNKASIYSKMSMKVKLLRVKNTLRSNENL